MLEKANEFKNLFDQVLIKMSKISLHICDERQILELYKIFLTTEKQQM